MFIPAASTLNLISVENEMDGNIDMNGFLINELGDGLIDSDGVNLG